MPDTQRDHEPTGSTRSMRLLGIILLTTVIGSAVVYAGFQILVSHPPRIQRAPGKNNTGEENMTADQLIKAIAPLKRPVFWLGPISGDTYLAHTTVSGIDIISYLPGGANLAHVSKFNFVIKTYKSAAAYNSQNHSSTRGAVTEDVGKAIVTYNSSSPNHSFTAFKDRPQVVTIDYPVFEPLSTLVADAQNLEPVR